MAWIKILVTGRYLHMILEKEKTSPNMDKFEVQDCFIPFQFLTFFIYERLDGILTVYTYLIKRLFD